MHSLAAQRGVSRIPSLRKSRIQRVPIARFTDAASLFAVQEGDKVLLPDGTKGLLSKKASNGWCTVEIEGSGEQKRFRSSALKSLAQPQQHLAGGKTSTNKLQFLNKLPELHEGKSKWIGFTDLHVHSRTMDTCLEVLNTVHKTALENDAGVLFLGDWWHVRGSLLVEQLNTVMRQLHTWDKNVPVVMIPGNHDQVTLGGALHSLEPLKYAFRGPEQMVLLSEPTVCMDALWLPYRRNDSELADMIHQATSDNSHKIGAIFCHADVKGAMMNDNMASAHGVELDAFPPNIPVFTGHFHKPHQITNKGRQVRYLGSPYQTSAAEALQTKYLYLFERNNQQQSWHIEQEIPIDVGRKHFRVTSLSDATLSATTKGDRVILSTPKSDVDMQRLNALRKQGVDVELRHPRPATQKTHQQQLSQMRAAQELDPATMFREYITSKVAAEAPRKSSTAAAESKSKQNALLKEGCTILANVSSLSASPVQSTHKDLKLLNVTLKNFGPYKDAHTYQLDKRGLVLVRAESTDATGADSNGAGKTSLAMSALWGLTGTLDARPVTGGSVAGVAYTDHLGRKSTAEVVVEGTINNKPFRVHRTRGSKTATVKFFLDGVELTNQDTKTTQDTINKHLGIHNGLLGRAGFFGQHAMSSLLTLSDADLKTEMSKVVDTATWVAAASVSRELSKECKQRNSSVDGELKVLNKDLAVLTEELEEILRSNAEKLNNSGPSPNLQAFQQSVVKINSSIQAVVQNVSRPLQAVLKKPLRKNENDTLCMTHEQAQKWHLRWEPITAQAQERNEMSIADCEQGQMMLDGITELLDTMDKKLNEISHELSAFEKDRLAPIKDRLKEITDEYDRTLSEHKQQRENLKREAKSAANQVTEAANDTAAILQKINTTQKQIQPSLAILGGEGEPKPRSNLSVAELLELVATFNDEMPGLATLLSQTEQEHEQAIATASSLDAQVTEMKARLHTLHAPNASCELCGQDISMHTRVQRVDAVDADLQDAKQKLEIETSRRDALQTRVQELRQRHDAIKTVLGSQDTLREFSERLVQLDEKKSMNQGLARDLEEQLQAMKSEHDNQQAELQHEQEQVNTTVTQSVQFWQNVSSGLKEAQDSVRAAYRLHSQASKKLGKATEDEHRLAAMREMGEKEQMKAESVIAKKRTAIAALEADGVELQEKVLIYNQLSEVFGVKGIQQHIYETVSVQLQETANQFLETLTDGTMQLQLRPDANNEKITKSVLFHAPGSEAPQERELTQLSGGQWRRVSLALDLAFASLLRQRGLLSSNVIVLDEVFTHLDASGRERVGSVLRGLYSRADLEPNEEVRPYETVILILQDSVASELEDAFDSIDVVMKDGTKARVVQEGVSFNV